MAHVLFIDESGQDHHESPYEVLGGVAVEDSRIWSLIMSIHDAEIAHFGRRLSRDELELKAKKLLKAKTFRLARQMDPFMPEERTQLAKAALDEGTAAKTEGRESRHSRAQLTALAQAKIAFCRRVFELCAHSQAKAFASIVAPDAPRPVGSVLRKDYAYLFERFYHFDELERSQSHILINQMSAYFQQTRNGRLRASRVLPEPMFVHSDLTSLIQVADLIVYVVSWAVRIKGMDRPSRAELSELAEAVRYLRYRTMVDTDGGSFERWSFVFIDDLRPVNERKGEQK
jgi:hypothetical protein